MSKGWVKIHRQIINWEWYDEPNTFRLFFHLLLKANHKPRKYRGAIIDVGQVMTGLDLLSKETGLSVQKIRTSLERLKSTNEITIKSSNKGTIIQIVKYKDYQILTSDITNEQQTTNKQLTTNKNVKNEEEVNLLYKLYPSKCVVQNRSLGKSSKNKDQIKKLLKDRPVEELTSIINRYIAECKKDQVYMMNFKTFLNNLPDYSSEPIKEERLPKFGAHNPFWT